MSGSRVVQILKDAAWLDADRARVYGRILGLAQLAGLVGLLALSRHGVDARGEPIGTDFSSFWTASELALRGAPASAWDIAAHQAAQQAQFGPRTGYYAFFYPPMYLLLCLPLAFAPYLVALALWVGATGALYLAALRRFVGREVGRLPLLAFPAVFSTVGHGQNAFLVTAIFAAALTALEMSPIASGALIGLLAFKPHLAIGAPILFLATGRWRAIVAAGAVAAAFAALSFAVLGAESWRAYFHASQLAKMALDDNMVGPGKMQSAYAAARVLGAGSDVGYVAQTIVALPAAVALFVFARRSTDWAARGAMTSVVTLLCSPFLLDYDLLLLAIPLAWLFREGLRHGFAPWEKTILLAGFALPAVSRGLATELHLPLGPAVVALVACAVWRRGLRAPAPAAAPALSFA